MNLIKSNERPEREAIINFGPLSTLMYRKSQALTLISISSFEAPGSLDSSIILHSSLPSTSQLVYVYIALLLERGLQVFMVRIDEAL